MKLIGNSNNRHRSRGGAHAAKGNHAAEKINETPVIPVEPASRGLSPEELVMAAAAAGEKGSKKERKPRRGLRGLLIAFCVIAVLAVSLVVAYSLWEAPPDIAAPAPTATPAPTPAPTPTPDPDETPDPEATPEPTEEPQETPEPDDGMEVTPLATEREDGIYTFLLVGRDHASNSTDTIIVGKFDTNAHTIDMVNIPRDTLVNISWGTTPKKINAVYPGYINSNQSGIEGLRSQIKNILGFDVDFYAVVNLRVVCDVIDEIGGVYFDVPIDMHYDDSVQDLHIHLEKGYQLLNGYETLGVFRFRYGGYVNGVKTAGYPGGDLQRIQVQQDLLMSIASQMLSLGNIPNLANIIELCVENVETTLSSGNMAFLARQFLKCSMSDINFHEAPIAQESVINGVSFVSLSPNRWIEVVNNYLNPYEQDVSTANVNILYAGNSDGSVLNSTTGNIAGSWDSFYCSMCTSRMGKSFSHVPGQCPTDTDTGSEDAPTA